MKRSHLNSYFTQKWRTPILTISLLSLILLFSLTLLQSRSSSNSNSSSIRHGRSLSNQQWLPKLPRFAYLITGTKDQVSQMKRLLLAVYHPRNYYVLHLDRDALDEERVEIAKMVKNWVVVRQFRNVMVIGKADMVTEKGPTVVANTLHAVAVLLKQVEEWDWFINLSACDYPLISQDGSPWVVLTKSFVDFCIWGRDNLPRTLLMYYTNFLSSAEGYFHTVVCNHKNYQNTTVNHDLRYVKLDNQNQQPINLTLEHFDDMVQSGAPFAHRFTMNDPVLEKIDQELLRRVDGHFVPGQWCLGSSVLGKQPCDLIGIPDVIKPSTNSKRLEKLVLKLLDPEIFRSNQCR